MNRRTPLFTVITPTLNASKCIERYCESLKNQTLKDFELIIIDADSKDNTIDLVKRYEKYFTIRILVQTGSGGIFAAWNQGVQISRGRWFIFVGADDYIADQRTLELVRNELARFSPLNGIRFVFGSIYIDSHLSSPRYPRINAHPLDRIRGVIPLPTSGVFISRHLFDDGARFDESYRICGDHEFFLRFDFVNTSIQLKLPIIVFSLGGVSTSNATEVVQYRERRRILTKFRRERPFYAEVYYFIRAHLNFFRMLR